MEIDQITSFKQLMRIEKEWDECLSFSSSNSIFLTFDWFRSWWQSFGKGNELRIVLFRDSKGAVSGIAPLMLRDRSLKFMASREVTDYCDLIIRQGDEEKTVSALFSHMRQNRSEAHRLHLMNIREDSPSLPLLAKQAARMNMPFKIHESEVALHLDLPPSYPDFLASLRRKNRHELRRKVRKMEVISGMEIKSFSDPEEIQSPFETFVDLHRSSSPSKGSFWQKKGIPEFFRSFTTRFSQKGWIELFLLFRGHEPAASLLSFIYRDEVLFYNIAYSPDFAAFSPGILLFNEAIGRAIGSGRRKVDFLRGREKYKYNFGAKECKIRDFNMSLRVGEK